MSSATAADLLVPREARSEEDEVDPLPGSAPPLAVPPEREDEALLTAWDADPAVLAGDPTGTPELSFPVTAQ